MSDRRGRDFIEPQDTPSCGGGRGGAGWRRVEGAGGLGFVSAAFGWYYKIKAQQLGLFNRTLSYLTH